MIYLFLAEGFEEIEALTVYDVLKRAEIAIKSVAVSDNTRTVTGAHGITVICDTDLKGISKAECGGVVLPGGMPGTVNLEKNDTVKEYILFAADNRKPIAAICAAPSVLGKLGLLAGKNAVCYPGFEEHLSGAVICENEVMTDENIITSRGPATAMAFALCIVEKLKGKIAADTVADGMLY